MLVRCPHCRNPIELVEESALNEVNCPSCGSSFSLVGTDSTVTQQPVKSATLGHFELGKQLGMGAFGTVWKAHDTELDRTVAIKIPRRGQLDPTEAEKFLREARAAAQLKHPNIVSVHEVGREADTIYIVSDFVDGLTLTDWLTGERPTPQEAAALCAKLSNALHHAHEQGVVHRDLKPGNIMLDRHNEPHVMDFGLAKREASEITMTMDGQILGTPAYMSPEQAKGEGRLVDRRADLFSLGVILFELLTGERPFRGSTRMLIHQLLTEEAPSPRKLNPSIPRDLETICLKCLEKDPARRYATAAALAAELERFLVGKPIHARPLSAPLRAWRWCRRRPVIAGLLAFAVLSLVTGSSVSIYFAVEARKQAQDALEKLRVSYVAQARAMRWSGRAGRRYDSLDALRKAAEIAPGDDLRDEAIASLVLADLREVTPGVHVPSGSQLVALDADFQRYAYGSAQGTVTLCRVSDGSELMTIPGAGSANAWVLQFSPQGNYLAAGYADGRLRVWKLAGETPELLIDEGYHQFAVDFDPSSRYLAVARADQTATVHDLQTGASEKFQLGVVPHSLEFDPAGERLAVSSIASRYAEVRDVKDGTLAARLLHEAGTRGVSWHPDGNLLAACCADSDVYLWDLSSQDVQRTLRKLEGHTTVVSRIAFNHSGDLLASNSWDGGLILWDPATSRSLVQIPAAAVPDLIEFSRDDRLLGPRLVENRLSFWEVAPGHELRILRDPQESRLWSVALSRDERLVAEARESGVLIRNTSTGKRLSNFKIGSTRSVFFLPERDALLTWGREGLLLWPMLRTDSDVGDTNLQFGAARRTGVTSSSQPEWASIDAEHRLVAVADRGAASVRIYDLQAKEIVLQRPFPNPSSIAISPDGKWLACGTWRAQKERVCVWNVETGSIVSEMPCSAGAVVTFSPDGRKLIFNANDLDYAVWNTQSWEPASPLTREGPGGIGVAFSKNSGILALGLDAERVRLVNAESLQPLANLSAGRPLMLSDSGRWLLALRRDQSAELWDLVRIRKQLREFKLDWDSKPLPDIEPPR